MPYSTYAVPHKNPSELSCVFPCLGSAQTNLCRNRPEVGRFKRGGSSPCLNRARFWSSPTRLVCRSRHVVCRIKSVTLAHPAETWSTPARF